MNDDVMAATKLQIWQEIMRLTERTSYDVVDGCMRPKPMDPMKIAEEAERVFQKLCIPQAPTPPTSPAPSSSE